MLLSNLVWGRQHIMCADNSPYLDPSPTILKAWKECEAQMGGMAAAAGGVGAASQQAGALAVAVAAAAAAGPAGGSGQASAERKVI
jgi:hypothetical protein